MEVDKRAQLVYKELREILERMDITVDEPKYATNPRKLGNMGIKCTSSEDEDEAWIAIKRNCNMLELVPPLYKFKERNYYTNESTNKDLCDLLNRVVREYVVDNKEILLNNDLELISDMEDLISQYNIIYRESCRFYNIKILRTSFYKNYIELEVLCRNKNSLTDESDWNIDFCVPILITKSELVADRRKENWVANYFSNREDIIMLIHKRNLKTFNRVLKDTIFKDIYEYMTRTNLASLTENNYSVV